ncbi:MAG: phosphoglycerate kinase [Parcubacteria group bacterium 21-54-25]|nr:MAG: phosphoglycerate kinase [Parcubacteria group bacterium 21-54-25]HQU07849.1 phosphoglycerate kinase [Candidatus Paceibacterota bacterium]
MKTLRDISLLHNVPVLVRAPLNEPIENGEIASDFRLRRTLPTIAFLANAGARVIVCGHIGRDPGETLAPVYRALAQRLSHVSFSPESVGPAVREKVRALHPGDVLVLENLRRHKGEAMNDPDFAHELAQNADVFVQDAFDTCHRKHASIVGVPALLPSYAGLLLEEEVRELSTARTPQHPALAVIGGAKFATKEPVLTQLLTCYDHVMVGGALANDFLVAKGYALGASLLSGADATPIKMLLANERLVLPQDVIIAAPDANVSSAQSAALDAIPEKEAVLDAGPKTQAALSTLAHTAQTILWNGPLGHYENGFTAGTKALAEAIAASSARSIVGGGDTITAIEELGIGEHFSFISTGGGAMLDFLTHGTLPGIEALAADQ